MSKKEVKVDYKVISSERRVTKNGDPYYVLELLDTKGDKHEAKVWNDTIAGMTEHHLPQEGQYWGNVKSHENVFKGQKQLIVTDYWVYQPDEVQPEVKEQFVEQPVIDVDRVIKRMFDWEYWDPDMYVLMQRVREHLGRDGVWEKIKAIPAGASYHHSVRGGFLLHIDEMLDFSENLLGTALSKDGKLIVGGRVEHYWGLIDYQILRAGIVLHDIGKVYDYDEKTLQYQPNSVSDCLEHTIVGILMVERYWINMTSETMDRGLRLQHALAAHHGPEMGAVKPKTPEAVVLHHLDMMSAHLDVCRRAYHDAKKNGNFSVEYSRMMGARPFVPAFFPPDYHVYESSARPDSVVVTPEPGSDSDPEPEGAGKLPWEE
jgi:3'-5' exoribonuclease